MILQEMFNKAVIKQFARDVKLKSGNVNASRERAVGHVANHVDRIDETLDRIH